MTSRTLTQWMTCAAAVGAVLFLCGCSSSKSYALVADVPANDHIVVASIEVSAGNCTVHVASLEYKDLYTPSCKVSKDESNFKSFVIDGKQIDFGAVDAGFKVLSNAPNLPPSDVSAAPAPATAAKSATVAKPAAPTAAPAASTAGVPAAVGEAFPTQWLAAPYPGHVALTGQNKDFLVTSATITIAGGDGQLDVEFKTKAYPPFHFKCIVVSNAHGDFRLVFNPRETGRLTGGGNYDLQLTSEGTGITGNVWDSHGFDSWTPTLPPQWTATSFSAD